MARKKQFIYAAAAVFLALAPLDKQAKLLAQISAPKPVTAQPDSFAYMAEQFADLQILRYQIKGFDDLSLKQKEMLYYLYQAALSGRDIIYDQNYKHNLRVRRTLETIANFYKGDRNTPEFNQFMVYAKRVWFSNGIHHHYSTKKILPEFPRAYLNTLIQNSPQGSFPLVQGETVQSFIDTLGAILFEPNIGSKRVNQDAGADLVAGSANNYYEGVTQKEAEAYYKKLSNPADETPISYGLNSKMVKEAGQIVEKTYKVGGMYSPAISQIVYWLEKALPLSENNAQKDALALLIEFYKTGDLKKFDAYNIAWVADTQSRIDLVNGFIEVYGDAMGYKGAFESVVSIKDLEATKRIAAIGQNAQWFEDQSPIMAEHKKKNVKGISAKVITVVVEAGDAAPSTPIGINLPNANWIRQRHGSKSVSLGNIVEAYDMARAKSTTLQEFAFSPEELARVRQYGALASTLHTDMHEVIGHASGQINAGVGTPKETLKSYASTLEEARADLVALYYMMDPKLIKLGVMPSLEVGKAEYDNYIRNGLLQQLFRLEPGDNLEEAHMRNRQLIAAWAFERGQKDKVIEKVIKGDKTYFVVRDYNKLRTLFGQLLREIQRITSEGDYEAGKNLVENYGVKVDQKLLLEVKSRYAKLKSAPYSGFIQPKLVPVIENDKITDVKVEYPTDFVKQMLEYGKKYSFLPDYN